MLYLLRNRMGNSCFLIDVISLVLLLVNIRLCLAAAFLDSSTDQHSLLAFKNSTFDPHRILANNWSANAFVCNWIGVTCGGIGRQKRVTALDFSGFGLIDPNLGNLTFLRYLDISSNNLTGSWPLELSRLFYPRNGESTE